MAKPNPTTVEIEVNGQKNLITYPSAKAARDAIRDYQSRLPKTTIKK